MVKKMNHEHWSAADAPAKDGADSLAVWLQETANAMERAGDSLQSAKMRELLAKWQEQTLMMTFCGHFSAGKSTVINRLCGRDLLPSSPIPTSANVVTVRYGDSRAEVIRRSAASEAQSADTVPLERLAEVCRDGETVERVILYDTVEWLMDGVALLDTPGVDSTDESHRAATEAAMHLADVVFYVTDYNHVQSEYNFAFAKEVADAGKPLVWIVNQIDKHREQELAFAAYQDDVNRALEAWQLHPAAVFFVTLKEPGHPLNEWMALERYLRQSVQDRERLVRYGVEQAARELIEAHARQLSEPLEHERRSWVEQAGGAEAVAGLREEHARLTAQLDEAERQADAIKASFQTAVQKLLRDANLTPAVTRDMAQTYLETLKPGFKVGLFFTAAKTIAERERRLQAFGALWKEGLRANAEVHVIQLVRELARQAGADELSAQAEMEAALPQLKEAWLQQEVQPGAWGTAEYTLTYSRAISEEAKALLRRAVMKQAEPYLDALGVQYGAQAGELRNRKAKLDAELEADSRIAERERELRDTAERLLRSWDNMRASRVSSDGLAALLPQREYDKAEENALLLRQPDTAFVEREPNSDASSPEPVNPALASGLGALSHPPESDRAPRPAADASQARRRLLEAAMRLKHAADALERLPAVQPLAQDLRDKAERLDTNRFTVALFGAFSAGKSSFANALMGRDALPVSPNPTTAAINTIAAPTDAHPHGTARVTMKSEAKMLADLRFALESMGEANASAMSMDKALTAIERYRPETLHPSGRPHYSFIQAVKRGYEGAREHLGESLHVSAEEYREYVREEWKSAFVERIDLFIDSPLTEQGFVFVDTPGADSINARHTGVAFEYMKNADVILFVTYYNHAFSQADRQFLTQLGRVKDAFELDKMFFVVNAADLAASDEELNSVMEYVGGRLLEFGIREPRLFPVSSLQALKAKLSGQTGPLEQSGIAAFEEAFMRFASEELATLSVDAARNDMRRVDSQLKAMWDAAHADASERAKQTERIRAAEAEAIKRCDEWLQRDERKRIEQEADELLYHVRQRLQYRFNDGFAYSFNPASLRKDEQNIDMALERCYLEWSRSFMKELTNELYATTLRLEQSAKRLAASHRMRLAGIVEECLPGFAVADESLPSWPTPDVTEGDWLKDMTTRWLRSFFRSSKAFFEGGGRDMLRQSLEERALQAVTLAVQEHRERFVEHIARHLTDTVRSLHSDLTAAVRVYADRLADASRTDYDPEPLRAVMKAIERSLA
ncbi:dynamin family protein [Paenibacillus apiarius]|uniref:dynamin family protein n=1 Tax=Paenibacillus apiarius TaxID=46240 RepID=UPI00197D3618|nr:dynamin family protein [Paenibacillus apiarius]MBN3527546.1 dynamin family protein [Paenibacillus apiarius]